MLGGRLGRFLRGALAAALLALAAALLASAPAGATTVTERPLLFRFDGSDTTAGAFSDGSHNEEGLKGSLAVDTSSGSVYVPDAPKDAIDKLNASGVAQNFSATGTSSLTGNDTPQGELGLTNREVPIAVDNSAVNPGRIYVAGGPRVNAFSPAGAFLWQLVLPREACGLAVDAEGHLWVATSNESTVREFATSGSPPAQIGSFTANTEMGYPCYLGIGAGASSPVYIKQIFEAAKYVGGAFDSTLDPFVNDLAVDQSSPTGHIFTLHPEEFNEYDSTGALLHTFGANTIYASLGIAYNPSLDRVYVESFFGRVSALGPEATGPVPGVTTEAATEIEVSKAKLNGVIEPEGVPSGYYFEWKQGEGENSQWGLAKSSPLQSLPQETIPEAVSFDATNLAGNTIYQARLIGVNTANHLRSVSSPVTFTTPPAAAGPAVTINPPSPVTATTAEVEGTVNPQGDFGTTWRLQLSNDPACASGFSDQPIHNLESEASSAVAVSEELTGLLPSEHYCVRIRAENSAGSDTSAVEEFTTEGIVPDGVVTAFAAPRTDTTARVNGRVNPEGEELTYQFEYSEDGGTTWIALPERKDTSEAREKIIVAEELSGLSPNTTYSYRFHVENPVGPASPQGEEKTFTTRTTAEMTIPPNAFGEPERRGIELVNQPDDGNQNVHMGFLGFNQGDEGGPISADGEKAVWTVFGGAPGAPNAAENSLLAERTPSGWYSRPIAPPVEQQFSAGALSPGLYAATPDFSQFAAIYFRSGEENALARFDQSRAQHLLATFPHEVPNTKSIDMTTDGAHVLLINPETGQIEDDGSGSPEVVSLMPDGTESECGMEGEGSSFTGASNGGQGAGRYWRTGYHNISTTDASRLYFQAKPNGSGCGGSVPLALYERNRESGVTTLIDPGPEHSGYEPHFIRATPDGRSAYFTTKSQLDPADTNSDEDVYVWDEEAAASRCLTCEATADANVANFANETVMVSNDFSHVYFESEEALAPGAEAGGRNIYALSGGAVRFVADVSHSGSGANGLNNAELSANGEVLVFEAVPQRGLTADRFTFEANGRPACTYPDGSTAPDCRKHYLYDDRDGGLECLDCLHAGISSHVSFFDRASLSDDGSTAVFVTPEGLVRRDVNHNSDLYEWRNGAVRLITDGVTSFPSVSFGGLILTGVDRDGSDAFFTVAATKLTGFEQSGLANAYDARIGGGFEVPSPPARCSEESCQGPLQSAPPSEQSASAPFSGRGNLEEHPKPRCRKGKVRRHGRCVSRHPHKRLKRAGANQRRAK